MFDETEHFSFVALSIATCLPMVFVVGLFPLLQDIANYHTLLMEAALSAGGFLGIYIPGNQTILAMNPTTAESSSNVSAGTTGTTSPGRSSTPVTTVGSPLVTNPGGLYASLNPTHIDGLLGTKGVRGQINGMRSTINQCRTLISSEADSMKGKISPEGKNTLLENYRWLQHLELNYTMEVHKAKRMYKTFNTLSDNAAG